MKYFDLFLSLDATDEQLDFPILYASGKDGWCVKDMKEEKKNLSQLLDLIIETVPPPNSNINEPFTMLTSLLDSDPFLGRCLTGKVESGSGES